MFVSERHNSFYYVRGTLLPRPGSNVPSLYEVEVLFQTYSIDFGICNSDPARGYWVSSTEKLVDDLVWYKFENPVDFYKKTGDRMEHDVSHFLR